METSSLGALAVTRPRVRLVVTWLLRIALAALFLGAGLSKLGGEAAMVDMFTDIGAGQWLRYVVGACEVAGAIGVLVPRLSMLAAGCLALLMVGATIANVVLLNTGPFLTVVIFVLAGLTAWLSACRTGTLRPGDRLAGPRGPVL